ncbi:GntR family transcriptional regulator [Actinacidiphila sp. DG2A-62]|uniref:GntR family transcriptional regulator n=1 Tax=Actinacidiphila sp. DG2A-62 TaxID=3108821 RepID=UPI002DBAAF61|nr:GntR family transcriptional regulator [Actinacidiphila sp. DG2A-62]MEC3997438.1 GntR family transcriptional regulator [Actinacidiphila sp. DG2A-62]
MFDRRPLHERIAADLRDEIMSGDLAPGSSLPSTQQLKNRFDAASATVQKALQLLKSEQLVVGRAGSAVTVRPHRQETVRPAAFSQPVAPGGPSPLVAEAVARGRSAVVRLLEVGEVRPPADVAAALRLHGDDTAVMRHQLLLHDGEPVELGYPPRRTVDLVSARVPTQEQYEALRLPGNLPVLRTLRVVHSDDDLPVEATVMAKAGHLHELRYDFT